MKLAHYELNTPIEFFEGKMNILVIENPNFMRKIVEELYHQSIGEEGTFIFSIDNETYPFADNVSVNLDPFRININERDILIRLLNKLRAESLGENLYLHTNELISNIEKSVQSILDQEYPYLEYDELDISKIFKIMNIRFVTQESMLERLCDYIDALNDYRKIKLFVFVNLKSFMDESQIKSLYKHAKYQKLNLLLIENKEYNILDDETITLIDKDLCEMQISEAISKYGDRL